MPSRLIPPLNSLEQLRQLLNKALALIPVLDADNTFTGKITTTGQVVAGTGLKSPSYTVGAVPSAATLGAGSMIYVSNEAGGAVLAFSGGASWRRVTDRAVIS